MLIIAGFIFMVFMIVVSGGMCMKLGAFVDIASILVVLVPLLFFMIASKNGGVLVRYIKSSLTKNYRYSSQELETIALAARDSSRFTMAVGLFGFLTGLIACLSNIDNPILLGANISVALITPMYSVAISFFMFFPLQSWASKERR